MGLKLGERIHEIFERVPFDRALFAFTVGFTGCASQEANPLAPPDDSHTEQSATGGHAPDYADRPHISQAEYRERVKHHPYCAWIRSRSPEVLSMHGIDLATFEREAPNVFTESHSADGSPVLAINSGFIENGIRVHFKIPEGRESLLGGIRREFEIFTRETNISTQEAQTEDDSNVVYEMRPDIEGGRFATSTPEEVEIKEYPGGRIIDQKKIYVAASSYLTPEMKAVLVEEPAAVQVAAYRLSVNFSALHEVVGHGGGLWRGNNHSEDPRSQMAATPSLKISTLKEGAKARDDNRSIPIDLEDGSREVVWVPVHPPKVEPLFMMARAQKWYYDEVIKKSPIKNVYSLKSNVVRTPQSQSLISVGQH